MKNKKNSGQLVQVGLRKFSVFKDYENSTITVLEGDKEVFHGKPQDYHRWIRKGRKLLAISRTKSK